MKWNYLIPNDYETYPNEGISVVVSDGANYDVAYYLMSGEYKWVKVCVKRDCLKNFKDFAVTKWSYIEEEKQIKHKL